MSPHATSAASSRPSLPRRASARLELSRNELPLSARQPPSGALAAVAPFPLRFELAASAAITAALVGLILAVGPAPGDAPAHLYRTFLVRQGVLVWDNLWYAGNYPLASYSLLYYLPAALVGNLTLVVPAAVASTVLFGLLTSREWGTSTRWATRAFAVLAAAPAFTGLYSYTLGFATMLGSLRALQARRAWVAIPLAVVTLGFSPLAFGFLVLILVAVVLARRNLSRRIVHVAVALSLLAGFEFAILELFPSRGVYPFHAVNFAAELAVVVVGALLARRAKPAAPITFFFLLWGASSIALYLLPTPLGDNWTRLGAFAFPLMLLTAKLARFRPRALTIVALAGAFAYSVTPFLILIPYRLDNRPASAAYWQPAIQFLKTHATADYRIEVVPTASHWEAYWLPRAGFALARGWYRQRDLVDNPVLYGEHLDVATYRTWLRTMAVEYVLLPHTRLDPMGAPREARILRAADSSLRVVFRTRDWTILKLADPSPLLTGPGRAAVTRIDHSTIEGWVAAPGRYLLRVHYTPYWILRGEGCVPTRAHGLTSLTLTQPGRFALVVPESPVALVDTSTDRGPHTC